MSAYEEVLEQRIEDAYQAFLRATTPEGKQSHFQTMRGLIAQRSAAAILRMEREKGLVG